MIIGEPFIQNHYPGYIPLRSPATSFSRKRPAASMEDHYDENTASNEIAKAAERRKQNAQKNKKAHHFGLSHKKKKAVNSGRTSSGASDTSADKANENATANKTDAKANPEAKPGAGKETEKDPGKETTKETKTEAGKDAGKEEEKKTTDPTPPAAENGNTMIIVAAVGIGILLMLGVGAMMSSPKSTTQNPMPNQPQ